MKNTAVTRVCTSCEPGYKLRGGACIQVTQSLGIPVELGTNGTVITGGRMTFVLTFNEARHGVNSSSFYAVSSDPSNVLLQRVVAVSRLQYELHVVVTAGFQPAAVGAVFEASWATPPALETANESLYFQCA